MSTVAVDSSVFWTAAMVRSAKDKSNDIARNNTLLNHRGEILFIDARKLGHVVDRTRREPSDADIATVINAYHAWRESRGYADVAPLPAKTRLPRMAMSRPRSLISAAEVEEDGTPFAALRVPLTELLAESARLTTVIREWPASVAIPGD